MENKPKVTSNTKNFKYYLFKTLPHIGAILVMYLLTIVYFAPVIMDNKTLPQSDMMSVRGMNHDTQLYHERTGNLSEWSNGMFSGMPTTTVSSGAKAYNVYSYVKAILRGGLNGATAGIMFTYLICFYIFMLCMGASPLLSILGAVGFTFCSYNFIIIDVGHITKAYAIAYIAPLIGGVILTFRKRYLFGGVITMLFAGCEIASNHQQITYYAFIIVILIVLAYLCYYIFVEKKMTPFFKAVGVLFLAAVLVILPCVNNLWPTYEYSKDTMRGGSVLTITPPSQKDNANTQKELNKGGLEIDYAYQWSYGKMESFTLLVPDLYGGGTTTLDKTSETAQQLRKNGYGSTYLPTYWGEQPFTAGPVYAGAIVCFLFVLGLCVVKGPDKWWVIAAAVVSLILAWGKNFSAINDFFFYHLPFYNKFRTPAMALIIITTVMPILGGIALKEIFAGEIDKAKVWKYTKISYYITGGLCLLIMFVAKIAFSFVGQGDAGFEQQLTGAGFTADMVDSIKKILVDYRQSMLYKDAFRSFVFISLAFFMLWLYLKDKLKKQNVVIGVLAGLMLIDGWGVCKRYLNDDHFTFKKRAEQSFEPTETDKLILQDKDINYRVLNLSTNTFNESNTSYFHKSIGGYSPAKLRRYQDIIDFYLQNEIPAVYQQIVKTQGTMQNANADSFKVLNMLNTRYIIVPTGNGATLPIHNPYAYGDAWYVDNYKFVKNPDEEILALQNTDLKRTAIIDQQYKSYVDGKTLTHDTTATIVNTLCDPNHLVYKTKASSDQLAVFSEVYYTKGGWVSYIDGKETPHFSSDYILRTMVVPQGTHTIEFKYIPHTRILACKITNVSSIIVLFVLCGGIAVGIVTRRKKEVLE